MVAVGLYHYYRQGVYTCPIYIKDIINTFKVLITGKARQRLKPPGCVRRC
jgi:hypothetical protein